MSKAISTTIDEALLKHSIEYNPVVIEALGFYKEANELSYAEAIEVLALINHIRNVDMLKEKK